MAQMDHQYFIHHPALLYSILIECGGCRMQLSMACSNTDIQAQAPSIAHQAPNWCMQDVLKSLWKQNACDTCRSGNMYPSLLPGHSNQSASALCHAHTSCCFRPSSVHTHHLPNAAGVNAQQGQKAMPLPAILIQSKTEVNSENVTGTALPSSHIEAGRIAVKRRHPRLSISKLGFQVREEPSVLE